MRVAVLLVATVSCAQPRPSAPGPLPLATEVARVRDQIQVSPLEMVFSGVRGEVQDDEPVAARNMGGVAVTVAAVELVGAEAGLFRLRLDVRLPLVLPPSGQLMAQVSFAPPAAAAPGVHRAVLQVRIGDRGEPGPPVDLAGLVIAGHRAEQEPTLAQILEALGFAVDTGGTRLHLGAGRAPIGAEVHAPRFRRARPGAVSLYPVARFSANDEVPYGIESGSPRRPQPLATVAPFRGQTLNPDLEPDGRTTFDPGEAPFGLYEASLGKTHHTDDVLNGGRHLARVYPLVGRNRAPVPDAYAVAFDEDGNGDYQDCVFVIWNVAAAP